MYVLGLTIILGSNTINIRSINLSNQMRDFHKLYNNFGSLLNIILVMMLYNFYMSLKQILYTSSSSLVIVVHSLKYDILSINQ
jgi:hypothetical protein